MSKLLYIEASPRKARSKSIAVAHAFLDAYRAANPSDEVITLDLWERKLPEFDGYTIDAKYQVLMVKASTHSRKPLGTQWSPYAMNSKRRISTSSACQCGTLGFPTS